MEAQADGLEKQLARIYSGKNDMDELQPVYWQDVQKQLNPNKAAIEFSHFPYHNGKHWTDSIIYVAILLKHDDVQPRIIPLFEEKQLDINLKRETGSDLNFINDLYRWERKNNGSGPGMGQQLYNLVWKPLEEYLVGAPTVYYLPSGRLHQLSFAAIPARGTVLLTDTYRMHQLSSLVQITNNHQEHTVKKIVLYGGIDYYAEPGRMQNYPDQYKLSTENHSVQADRSLNRNKTRSGYLTYLDGAMAEVRKIRELAEAKGANCVVLTEVEAIEESEKRLFGNTGPDVLHIATHGFFFPDAVKNPDARCRIREG